MPRKKSIYTPDVNDQVQEQQRERQSLNGKFRVPLPNGRFAALDDLIDVECRPENHSDIFSDTAKFLKAPNPGCMYAWVNYKKQGEIHGKVRSGAYRIVSIDEFKDDVAAPVMTHKMAGVEGVMVYDVVCVEIQPRAIPGLYKWREKIAIQKTMRNEAFEVLNKKLQNETEGRARAELTFKELEQ